MALFPFLPTPNFAVLLRLGSAELLDFYQQTKAVALELAQAYGAEYHARLAQSL